MPNESRGPSPLWFLTAAAALLLTALWDASLARVWIQEDFLSTGLHRSDGMPVGGDYVQFAAVARAWESGTIANIYEPATNRRLIQEVADLDPDLVRKYGYNYPPFYCWLPRIFAGLPYRTGFVVWLALNLVFAFLAVVCWHQELHDQKQAFRWIVLYFVVTPATCITIISGQTAFLGLAALSGCLLFLDTRRDFLAGLCLSVLFYKPPLGIVLGPLLVWKRRWWSIAGVAAGAVLLTLASFAVSPKAVADYPGMLQDLKSAATDNPDFYRNHSNWLAFCLLLSQHALGHMTLLDGVLWLVPSLGILTALFWIWRGTWLPATPRFHAALSASILATLLLTPYLFLYDTILTIAALVYTSRTLPHRPRRDWWLLLACLALLAYDIGSGKAALRWLPIQIQLAPLAFLVWFVLEVRYGLRERDTAVLPLPSVGSDT